MAEKNDKSKNYPSYQQQVADAANNEYADRAAAQEKVNNQQATVDATPNAEVADFAAGKAAANGGTTPVTSQPTVTTPVANQPTVEGDDLYRQPIVDAATGQPIDQKYVQLGETQPDSVPEQLPADNGNPQVAGVNDIPGSTAGYTFTESQMKDMGLDVSAPNNTPATDDTKPSPKTTYLTDWNNTSLDKFMANGGKDIPKREVIDNYLRWCYDNGIMPNYYTINDVMNNSVDLKNSAADDEKARKKAERKERFDRWGNFLLHLGNAIGNVAGHGYASMKLEDPVQWTERQRLIKEKTEQQRRLNNQSIFAQMNSELQAQRNYDLKKRQAAALATYRQSQAEAAKQKAENDKQKAGAYVAYYNAKTGAIEMKTPEEIAKIKAETQRAKDQGNAAVIRANKTGSSSKGKQSSGYVDIYERDRKGRTLKHERTPKGSTATPEPAQTTPKSKAEAQKKWASRKVQ